MASPKQASARRVAQKRSAAKAPARRRARTPLRTLRNEIALRYADGREAEVRARLEPFGTLTHYAAQRMLVLHRTAGVTQKALTAALEDLRRDALVEFVTPVLVDRDSKLRQVLTDEIVVRLKPGTSKRTLAAIKAAHGLTAHRQNAFEPSQYIVTVPSPSGTQTLDVAKSIAESTDVEFASPNFLTAVKR